MRRTGLFFVLGALGSLLVIIQAQAGSKVCQELLRKDRLILEAKDAPSWNYFLRISTFPTSKTTTLYGRFETYGTKIFLPEGVEIRTRMNNPKKIGRFLVTSRAERLSGDYFTVEVKFLGHILKKEMATEAPTTKIFNAWKEAEWGDLFSWSGTPSVKSTRISGRYFGGGETWLPVGSEIQFRIRSGKVARFVVTEEARNVRIMGGYSFSLPIQFVGYR